MAETEECRELLAKLSALLEGEIEDEGCAALREHLESCPGCRACRDILSASVSLCGHRTGLPDESRTRILERIRRGLERG